MAAAAVAELMPKGAEAGFFTELSIGMESGKKEKRDGVSFAACFLQ